MRSAATGSQHLQREQTIASSPFYSLSSLRIFVNSSTLLSVMLVRFADYSLRPTALLNLSDTFSTQSRGPRFSRFVHGIMHQDAFSE